MVMRKDDGAGTFQDGWFEDFSGVNERRVERADGDEHNALHPLLCVEARDDKTLSVVTGVVQPVFTKELLGGVKTCYARSVVEGTFIHERHALSGSIGGRVAEKLMNDLASLGD